MITILLCCFNEKATILAAIKEAKELPIEKEIIVIDNASTDGTREILKGLKDDSIKIVYNERNLGGGGSAQLGNAMAKGAYVTCPGTDLEYRMADILEMYKKLESEKLDVVFGSRLLGKNLSACHLIKERPFWLGSIIATKLINMLYGRDLTDVIAPKLIKTKIINGLPLVSMGHTREFEVVSWLCKKGYTIGEIPVYYKPRTHKEGKTIRVYDMIPALLSIFRIKFLNSKNGSPAAGNTVIHKAES